MKLLLVCLCDSCLRLLLCFSRLILIPTRKHVPEGRRRGDSLGLGHQEGVIKEEEVSLLGLQACLQLCLGVTQEKTGWTLGKEGLDQGT